MRSTAPRCRAWPLIGSVPLWSSEPELQSYTPQASAAPAWNPEVPSCTNNTVAWQYLEQGVNPGNWPPNSPNVDVDEFAASAESLLWNAPKGPGAYTPLAPFRVCDTRRGNRHRVQRSWADPGRHARRADHRGHRPLGPVGTVRRPVGGPQRHRHRRHAATSLTVFPTGYALPNASNLNVDAATTRPTWWSSPSAPAARFPSTTPRARSTSRSTSRATSRRRPALVRRSVPPHRPAADLRHPRSGMGTACSGHPADRGRPGRRWWSRGAPRRPRLLLLGAQPTAPPRRWRST